MSMTRFVGFVCAAALLTAGCGGGNATRPQKDDELLSSLVTGTPDKALNPNLAKDHFVSLPDRTALRRYTQLSFEPTGEPKVSGETATVPVRVTAPDGTAKGEVEWTFAKVGDRWKLKDAPLP